MDLIAVEGHNVVRSTVGAITMYIGSRYDVVLCFDQARLQGLACRLTVG